MNDSSQRPEIAGTPEELYNSASRPPAHRATSAVTPAAPHVRRFPPLFKCLGYIENAQGARRFVVAVGTPERVLIRRASEMIGLEFLFAVYPNTNYWRALFPRPAGRRAGVDTQEAGAWFVKECTAAGRYQRADK